MSDEKIPVAERARRYVARIDGAVSGANGHDATFRVACALVIGFALEEGEALIILSEWNQKCVPPWSEKDLRHKIGEAAKNADRSGTRPRGYLLRGSDDFQPSRRAPGGIGSTKGCAAVPSRKSRPAHVPCDADLLKIRRTERGGGGVGEFGDFPVSAFAAAADVCGVKRADGDAELDGYDASAAEAVPVVDAFVDAYGSRAAFDGALHAALGAVASRWVSREMRWPNVVLVDPRVRAALPEVLDGMIVRDGDSGRVHLKPVVWLTISGGMVVKEVRL